MKHVFFVVIFLMLGIISCKENTKVKIANKITKKPTLLNISYPVEAKFKSSNGSEGDTLYAKLDMLSFIIYPSGKIEEFQKNVKIASYKLETNDIVDAAYLCLYKNNLIVYYTDTDEEDAGSFVESFNMKTKKCQWKANTYGFNLGQPVNRENITYVSTIGFVGKLNLLNGKYFWKSGDLYDRNTYSFNQFDSVSFLKNNVLFISKNLQSKSADTIIVNDLTGKLTIKKRTNDKPLKITGS